MRFTIILVSLALGAIVVYLSIQVIRLRLEVWANQRVIAALEQADRKPAVKKSRLPELLAWALLILLAGQILGLVFVH